MTTANPAIPTQTELLDLAAGHLVAASDAMHDARADGPQDTMLRLLQLAAAHEAVAREITDFARQRKAALSGG